MNIQKEEYNELLKRRRITIELEHFNNPTPKKEIIKEKVAEKYKQPPETISIRHIYPKFGRGISKVIAHIYEKEETKDYLEPKKKIKEQKV
jgi:small subunit ribosomal protein S24e